MTNKTRVAWGGLVLGLLTLVGGCSKEITASELRHNPTPELQSIALTSEQRKNRHARTFDTQFREIPDDLDKILLLDRPVRFSRYPIP